jgi:hypothetical protein
MSYGINLNVDATPRFDARRYVEFNNDAQAYDILTSDFVNQLVDIPAAGEIQVLVDAERLDNISYKLYNSTQYWWVLALYNYMPCHKYVKQGTVIRYFSLSNLEKLNFSLKGEND